MTTMTEPLVVLLHGLARGRGSMAPMAGAIRRDLGYDTWTTTYASREQTLATLAAATTDLILQAARDRPLLAVTHSMGGVLVRHLQDPRLRWQRIVMLAPPNRGSSLAAALVANPLFAWFYGPAGTELADGSAWPAPPAPFAVIAGTRRLSLTNVTSWTLGRRLGADTAHDGTVTVDETRLDGMTEHALVDATHTWMMRSREVQRLVVRYLRDGSFGATRSQ